MGGAGVEPRAGVQHGQVFKKRFQKVKKSAIAPFLQRDVKVSNSKNFIQPLCLSYFACFSHSLRTADLRTGIRMRGKEGGR